MYGESLVWTLTRPSPRNARTPGLGGMILRCTMSQLERCRTNYHSVFTDQLNQFWNLATYVDSTLWPVKDLLIVQSP